MEYISAREAADKWGISQRRVAVLCSENRIAEAQMVGNMWIIPAKAEKPIDARSIRYNKPTTEKDIKPFLKWAGGKGQLLKEISRYYPFKQSNITKYAEPFIGGGAVLFDVLNEFDLEEIYISDINSDLINTYTVIRDNVNELIFLLEDYQEEYVPMDDDARREYYLAKRDRFNQLKKEEICSDNIEKAALMIFLNKTCFNGLYRVNRKGLFNVPMGAYKNPLICDENNLRSVSRKLQRVKIVNASYDKSAEFIDENTFVYIDPPYRPLTQTAMFTSYNENEFNDEEQIKLADFVKKISKKGAKVLVSNSDPKNSDENDNFFDDLYGDFTIDRVQAKRSINSNGKNRGPISEILVRNY